MQNYKFIVKGRVQGVFYRKIICENALKENFKGYVKNLPDGTVEAAVSCIEGEVDNFMKILKKGSSNSIVDDIETLSCDKSFHKDFEIRY